MWRNKAQEKKNLLKEISKLGYEIGYYRHIEGVGWVDSEKSSLYRKAVELKITDEFDEIFEHSKEIGRKKREIDNSRGLSKEKLSAKSSPSKKSLIDVDEVVIDDEPPAIIENEEEETFIANKPLPPEEKPMASRSLSLVSKKGPSGRQQTALPSFLKLFGKKKKKK